MKKKKRNLHLLYVFMSFFFLLFLLLMKSEFANSVNIYVQHCLITEKKKWKFAVKWFSLNSATYTHSFIQFNSYYITVYLCIKAAYASVIINFVTLTQRWPNSIKNYEKCRRWLSVFFFNSIFFFTAYVFAHHFY